MHVRKRCRVIRPRFRAASVRVHKSGLNADISLPEHLAMEMHMHKRCAVNLPLQEHVHKTGLIFNSIALCLSAGRIPMRDRLMLFLSSARGQANRVM